MIESGLIMALRADVLIPMFVSAYKGAPAIFDSIAPSDAADCYVTVAVQGVSPRADDHIIDVFNTKISLFDRLRAASYIRRLAQRIMQVCDGRIFETDFYRSCRTTFDSMTPIFGDDVYDSRIDLMFRVAGCKKQNIFGG